MNSENCLETIFPELAKEWHPTKNGKLTSEDVTDGSKKVVWWLCKKDMNGKLRFIAELGTEALVVLAVYKNVLNKFMLCFKIKVSITAN
ncbi:zinc-ribbon domain-containing protein [Peribacillus frigoritolerans]|uniref:zinc-ribbon domain-containing protein n=1 Tax=Peribacillus frigoritolerans TaxID=450367 RepID=UPI002E23097C|nr:zinc-ribbon domain-containing protein [Peribacillus frigoritolerans]